MKHHEIYWSFNIMLAFPKKKKKKKKEKEKNKKKEKKTKKKILKIKKNLKRGN